MSQLITGTGKGRGKSLEFEFAARTILATGCSARAARDQMLVYAQLFLPRDKFTQFAHEVPSERWLRYQRKGLGYEAWLYSMLRVANCESMLQWGFDETSLDGTTNAQSMGPDRGVHVHSYCCHNRVLWSFGRQHF